MVRLRAVLLGKKMKYTWRVVVKASIGCGWFIVYEGDDYDAALKTYHTHSEFERRTVMEKI